MKFIDAVRISTTLTHESYPQNRVLKIISFDSMSYSLNGEVWENDVLIERLIGVIFDIAIPGWEPVSTKSDAIKYDSNKPPLELLPADPLIEIAKALDFGRQKYDAWNWTKGFKWSRLIGAAMRHLFAFAKGEDKDPESNLSHLAHLGCCVLFLLWHEKHKPELDDRFKNDNT